MQPGPKPSRHIAGSRGWKKLAAGLRGFPPEPGLPSRLRLVAEGGQSASDGKSMTWVLQTRVCVYVRKTVYETTSKHARLC